MVDEGLFEPYTPSSSDEIPEGLQGSGPQLVAAYYGIMAFLTNTTIVRTLPKTFADFKKPEYKGLVALNGDPREAGAAFAAVMAASLANGGSADDIMPGIQYFADLKKSGNLGGTDVTEATVLSGETPIAIDWSYNFPGLHRSSRRPASRWRRRSRPTACTAATTPRVPSRTRRTRPAAAVARAHPVRRGRARLPRGWRHAGPLPGTASIDGSSPTS